jgi:hypothetical protein
MMGVAEEILATLEARFLQTGHPSALTVVHAAGQSNRREGFEHFAVEGLVTRVAGSHWGLMPRMSELLGSNQAEAICLPAGTDRRAVPDDRGGPPRPSVDDRPEHVRRPGPRRREGECTRQAGGARLREPADHRR